MKQLLKMLLTRSAAGDLLGRIPGMGDLYARAVWRRSMNLFFGVYGTFDEALAAAARYDRTGWDDPGIAALLVPDAPWLPSEPGRDPLPPDLFQPSFYAVFLWLSALLREGSQIVDFGGAGGIGFELYARYRTLPAGARWHVVDLPALVERGCRRHAERQDVLTFGTDLSEAPACDILLASGCLQYVADPVNREGGILSLLRGRPAHLLINKVPFVDGPGFVTLQALGKTIAPYHVFNRAAFLDTFAAQGYRLHDEWHVAELSADIPFHSGRHVADFRGVYLRNAASG